MKTCAVIGAGITGATAAWHLTTRVPGWRAVVYEALPYAGGNLKAEHLGGIPYEPHGYHVFHTDSDEVYRIVSGHCQLNGYRLLIRTLANGHLLTWPLQVRELAGLPEWPQIKGELDDLPPVPDTASFETYAVSVMGKTLYEWCCYGYTFKQWGTEPRLLSSSFAPKRIGLRDDGIPFLFRNRYEGWCEGGWQVLVENLLKGTDVILGQSVCLRTLPPADAYIVTAALDDFLEEPVPLSWRGVSTVMQAIDSDGPVMETAALNHPGLDVPYTKKVETRLMSQAEYGRGTVITYEYPGAPERHYPVDDVKGENRARHLELAARLAREEPRIVLAGRLATYSYIDIDQAVMQGLNAARKVARNRIGVV